MFTVASDLAAAHPCCKSLHSTTCQKCFVGLVIEGHLSAVNSFFKKPVWEDLSFVRGHIIMVEGAFRSVHFSSSLVHLLQGSTCCVFRDALLHTLVVESGFVSYLDWIICVFFPIKIYRETCNFPNWKVLKKKVSVQLFIHTAHIHLNYSLRLFLVTLKVHEYVWIHTNTDHWNAEKV